MAQPVVSDVVVRLEQVETMEFAPDPSEGKKQGDLVSSTQSMQSV